jgi:hypothetical protein
MGSDRERRNVLLMDFVAMVTQQLNILSIDSAYGLIGNSDSANVPKLTLGLAHP